MGIDLESYQEARRVLAVALGACGVPVTEEMVEAMAKEIDGAKYATGSPFPVTPIESAKGAFERAQQERSRDECWNEALAILVQIRTNWRRALDDDPLGLNVGRPAWDDLRAQCERIEALLRRAGVRV